jgi:hypothetical protein
MGAGVEKQLQMLRQELLRRLKQAGGLAKQQRSPAVPV